MILEHQAAQADTCTYDPYPIAMKLVRTNVFRYGRMKSETKTLLDCLIAGLEEVEPQITMLMGTGDPEVWLFQNLFVKNMVSFVLYDS